MKRSATGDPPGTPSASQGSSSGGGTSEGPASKKRIVFEPIQLGPIANLEELEVKFLFIFPGRCIFTCLPAVSVVGSVLKSLFYIMLSLAFSGEDAGLPEPKAGAQADPEDRHGGGTQVKNRSGV